MHGKYQAINSVCLRPFNVSEAVHWVNSQTFEEIRRVLPNVPLIYLVKFEHKDQYRIHIIHEFIGNNISFVSDYVYVCSQLVHDCHQSVNKR